MQLATRSPAAHSPAADLWVLVFPGALLPLESSGAGCLCDGGGAYPENTLNWTLLAIVLAWEWLERLGAKSDSAWISLYKMQVQYFISINYGTFTLTLRPLFHPRKACVLTLLFFPFQANYTASSWVLSTACHMAQPNCRELCGQMEYLVNTSLCHGAFASQVVGSPKLNFGGTVPTEHYLNFTLQKTSQFTWSVYSFYKIWIDKVSFRNANSTMMRQFNSKCYQPFSLIESD